MDYQNGKIYQITDIAYTKCYIGSTTQSLAKRLSKHKTDYKVWKDNNKRHKTTSYDLFEEFGIENCKIELIEDYPCNSKNELERKEGEIIKNTACVNRYIPGRTDKQYYIDNIEKIKQYRLDNKDKIKQYNNKENICICGGKYTTVHKSQHINSYKHQSFIKPQEIKSISQKSFNFLFKMDSFMLIPRTYESIKIIN